MKCERCNYERQPRVANPKACPRCKRRLDAPRKKIALADIIAAVERASRSTDNPGFCTACGEEVEGVEPDAEKLKCEACGEHAVYGAEQLLIMEHA